MILFVMDKENRIKLLNQVEHVVQTIETLEASNKPLGEEIKLYQAFSLLTYSTSDIKKLNTPPLNTDILLIKTNLNLKNI